MAPSADAASRHALLGAWQAALGRRFAITYAAISAALFALYCFPYAYVGISERAFDTYLGAYARLVGAVLGLFGEDVSVWGTHISGRFPLEIVRNCDAIEVMILLSGAILAVSAPLSRRAVALGAGLGAVVALNVVRIVSLYYVGVYAPERFKAMHEEVFPLVLVAFAALAFVVALGFLHAPTPSASASPGLKGTG